MISIAVLLTSVAIVWFGVELAHDAAGAQAKTVSSGTPMISSRRVRPPSAKLADVVLA